MTAWLLCAVVVAQEIEEAPPPWTGSVSLTGNGSFGNLDQVQLRLRGTLEVHRDDVTSDLLLSAYRLWQAPAGSNVLARIGDDLLVQDRVGGFVTPRVFVDGVVRYERSLLHRLDHRLLGGGGLGYAFVREPDRRLRALVGGLAEYARYPGEAFRIDVASRGPERVVGRVSAYSEGFWRPKGKAVSARYSALFVVAPADLRDLRLVLDGAVDVRAWGPLGVRVSATYAYTAVVLEGVDPQDLQLMAGVSLSR